MKEVLFSQQLDLSDRLTDHEIEQVLDEVRDAILRRCDFEGEFKKFVLDSDQTCVFVRSEFISEFWDIGLYASKKGDLWLLTYSARHTLKTIGKVEQFLAGPAGCFLFPLILLLLLPGVIKQNLEEHEYRKREPEMQKMVSIVGAAIREGVQIRICNSNVAHATSQGTGGVSL